MCGKLLEEEEELVRFGFGSISVRFWSVGRKGSGLKSVWSRFGLVFWFWFGLLVQVGLPVRVNG